MKKILLITILLSLTRLSVAQNIPSDLLKNYSILNEANSDFFNGKYQIAYEKFRQIQSDKRVNYISIHNYIKCCIKLGLINEAKKNIEYCISNFGIRYSVFNNNNYGIEKDDKRFIDIKENEQVLLNNFYTIGRISDIKLLEHYFRTDMFMRNEMSDFNLNSKCDDFKSVTEEIKYIHDTTYTLPYLRQLIKKYNFPNAYDIGDENDDYFYLLIRHNMLDSSIYNKALYNGKIGPYEYASIMDYHYNWDFKTMKPKQNYGPNLTKVDNLITMGYIDDIEHVDERRAKIGLLPIWQTAKLSKRPFQLSKEYIAVLKKNGIKYE